MRSTWLLPQYLISGEWLHQYPTTFDSTPIEEYSIHTYVTDTISEENA